MALAKEDARWMEGNWRMSDRPNSAARSLRGGRFSLDYSVSGGDGIQQMLMSKGNGKFVLALWQGVSVTGGDGQTQDISNPTIPVTLTLPQGSSIKQYLPSTQGASVVDSASGVSNVQLEVPDEVLLVEISGGQCVASR